MREALSSNDEVLFDRLVDGELSDEERRTLLQSLDSRPDGWRRCAIAFLEAQSWRDECRQFANGSHLQNVEPPSPAVLHQNDGVSMKSFIPWAAIAASLLLAFVLGVSQSNLFLRQSETRLAEAPRQPENTGPVVELDDLNSSPNQVASNAAPSDTLTLWTQDESGQPRHFRVPLMDASTLDRELGVRFRPGMPDNVRSSLQDGGYDVQSRQRYAPIWIENGQRLVVPVEDTKIVPVSQNVY